VVPAGAVAAGLGERWLDSAARRERLATAARRRPFGRVRAHVVQSQPERSGSSGGAAVSFRTRTTPLAVGATALLPFLTCTGCSSPRAGVDLLAAKERLVEASVAGRDRAWAQTQSGKLFRIGDRVMRTLPAAPESRLRFRVDVPNGARLSFAYAVNPEYYDSPAVEFSVRAGRKGREQAVWTSLADPLSKPAHRGWLHADVDLQKHAGRGVELVFETRSFEKTDDPRRAFWGAPAVTVESDSAPLAIIFLVDTLRADHTTPYGYGRDTTPELKRFSRDAVVFEQAIVQASWTKPSVASILTSLLPGRHLAVQLRDPLESGHVTLGEMLQAKGYATGAAIANSVIYSAGNNFEQGFDSFSGLHDAEGRASKEVPAGPVMDEALRFLDSRRGLPTFLYVHTMDPHVPYLPPPPFDRKFEPHPKPGHPGVDPRTDYKEPADRERLIAQYDGDIAYGDQEFGRFLDELKKRGLYDRALIVFMADHGEEFLDHGQWLHGRSVFDELVRIPLIVKFPRSRDAGKRVRQQVQSVDVLPTVLAELGLPVPAPPVVAGRPLQNVVRGGAPEPPAVSEISHRGHVAHGMRTGRDKYIQSFSPREAELYFDLIRDPKEQTSRLAENGERVRLLRAGVEAAMVPDPFRRHLRALGSSEFDLLLRTPGWIDGVEPVGLASGERCEIEGNGRKLALRLKPRPGQPREVAFSVRPLGAPVWLEGTRDGRPLRPDDVLIAEDGVPAGAVPVRFPEIESEAEKTENVLAAPRSERAGLHLWLTLAPGRKVLEFDEKTREQLKALGYLGG
jgi:arylsulfatase A-like enzyme